MDRIKSRQQKFKRGKERMLSLAQESGESQSVVKEEEEEDEGTFVWEHFELKNIMFSQIFVHFLKKKSFFFKKLKLLFIKDALNQSKVAVKRFINDYFK